MDISKFGEYGLLGLIIGSIIVLLFCVIKWTLSTTREILFQAAEERKGWQDTIRNINASINNQTTIAREFHASQAEANRYQRAEHMEMIQVLGRINGYKT